MVPHAGRRLRSCSATSSSWARPWAGWPRCGGARSSRHGWRCCGTRQAWWAAELEAHPTVDLHYLDLARDLHGALLDAGVAVDVLPAARLLDGYDVVLVPTLYLAPEDLSDRLTAVVARGGQVLVSYFSGIVDDQDRVLLGGYPGAFRDLLGVRVEEFAPLRERRGPRR